MRHDLSRYRRLLRYSRPYAPGWISLLIVSLASAALTLLEPWPLKILVDQILGSVAPPAFLDRVSEMLPWLGTKPGLLVAVVAGTLAIFLLGSLAEVFLTLGWVRIGQKMVYDLSADLFANLQRRSLAFHTKHPVGDLMSRITGDSFCVNTVLDALLLSPVQSALFIGGMITVMLQLDVQLTLLSLVVAPLIAGASVFFGKPIRSAALSGREVQSRIQAHVQRTLSGIPVVQSFAQEHREDRRFAEFADEAVVAEQRLTLITSVYSLGAGFFLTVGTALVLWFGANRVLEGSLTVGGLLVFLAYLHSLQKQLTKLSTVYGTLQRTNASMDRVMEILDFPDDVTQKPDATSLPTPVRGDIRIENATFGYEPEHPVLRGVTLEAKPGETIAVVGPTGAGKSTLLGLVPRFADPWQGRVTLDGHDIRDLQLHALRAQIGIVMQEPFLLPLTIAGNIAFGRPDASMEEIEAAARDANAHAFIEKLPDGYQTRIGERGTTLSGGERQRLSIARALLKDAPILILDEPTSALDALTESLLLEALERLMKNRTTLVIAHRLSTIRNADRILVLEAGVITECGTHEELLALNGHYARLHLYQSGKEENA